MMNFEQARANMVDCQIHPMGISVPRLLEAYQSIPRELFVPEHQQGVAYTDEDIPLEDNRFLMDAATHARLTQALELSDSDAVLDIGDMTGYSAAVLSKIAGTVITIDDHKEFPAIADKRLAGIACSNVVSFQSSLRDGLEKHATYDAILINGAASFVPKVILEQLADNGRLAVVLKEKETEQGKAMLYVRTGNAFSERCLFDSSVPYLPGFEPKHDFTL